MQRTNLYVRSVVVQYQVIHAMHALEARHLLYDLSAELGRNAGFRYGECSSLRDHTLPRYWCGAVCGVVQGRSRGDVHL